MLSTVFIRTSPRLAARAAPQNVFSTPHMTCRPISTEASAQNSGPWSWSKLSPTTRRNIKVALAVGAATDAYVLYHYYPNMIGATKKVE
jgi:hypothetical protein